MGVLAAGGNAAFLRGGEIKEAHIDDMAKG